MAVDLKDEEFETPVVSILEDLKTYRLSIDENQTDFWKRFGLTQPGGSRYEGKQPIPKPTALLIGLYLTGKITEEDLVKMSEVISTSDKIAKFEKITKKKK